MTSQAPSIRRSTIDRIPLYRRIFAPAPRRRMPRWLRRLLLLLGILLLLLLAFVSCREYEKPTSLATSTLAGPRLITGPICIEQAVDVSGSMDAFQTHRERAEQEMFTFASRVLTKDDLFSEAFFAGSSVTALSPSSMATLTAPPAVPEGIDYTGTRLVPAVDALVDARAAGPGGQPCAARALVVITDGVIGDDPDTLAASLRQGGYSRMFAVIPSETGWGRPAELSGGVRDSISVYHFADPGFTGQLASVFDDAKPLDVVFGEIIGSLTGQTLTQLDPSK